MSVWTFTRALGVGGIACWAFTAGMDWHAGNVAWVRVELVLLFVNALVVVNQGPVEE